MPVYVFKVIDAEDAVVRGTMAAATEAQAQLKLSVLYKKVLTLKEESEAKAESVRFRRSPRVKQQNLSVYCRQLAVMVKAGVPINKAFRFCAEGEDQALNVVMQRVAVDVESGKSVSGALMGQPRVFGQLFIGLVRAGERSGTLDQSLNKLSELLEKTVTMQKRVTSAMSYPSVIFVASLAMSAFFTFYIMPMMLPFFRSMDVALPWPTRMLVAFTEAARNPFIAIPVVAFVLVGLFFAYSTYQKLDEKPEFRHDMDLRIMKLPVLGKLVTLAAQAKVLYAISTMLDAGVPLTDTMTTVEKVSGNEVLAIKLKKTRESLLGGTSLATSLTQYETFEPMTLSMIQVGEETGELSEMMRRVADLHEEEVANQLEALTSLIEPLIMAVMGLLVGFITIACFMPMVGLLNSISL